MIPDLRTSRNGRNGHARPQVIDRLPPNDGLAEQAVLGSMILAPNDAIPVCVLRIAGDVEVFYDLSHQEVYRVLVEMYDSNETIDLVTLQTWLSLRGLLDQIGGVNALAGLMEATPCASSVDSYLDIILEKHRSRKTIRLCTETVGLVFDHEEDTPALIESTAQELSDLSANHQADEESTMHDLINRAVQSVEEIHAHQGSITGLSTGFVDLDRMTTGLHGGEMIVLAARPSIGKTTLGLNILTHVALNLHLPVGMFSLEMTRNSLALKMLCSEARVNIRNVMDGFLSQRDMQKIATAAAKLNSAPIHINDASGLSILGLRTRARRMHRKHGIKLLVIDYLQLMSAERKVRDSRENEVTMISHGVKALAKELNIPIIAIAQLNRNIENDKSRKPRLSDLRESGSIEQDADVVAFIYKPAGREDEDQQGDILKLSIAKQRNGPTGVVSLVFFKEYSRFESEAKIDASDYQAPYADHAAQPEFPVSEPVQ